METAELSFETQVAIRGAIVLLEDYESIETSTTVRARIRKTINELRKFLPEFRTDATDEYGRTRLI